jgi:hypothetical protein
MASVWVLLVTALGWPNFGIRIHYLVNFPTQVQNDTPIMH